MTPIDNNVDGNDHHLIRPDQPSYKRGLKITYDADGEIYHVSNDPDSALPLTITIIQAIGTLTETDPLDLEPLANYIDPDHLEGLFNPTHPVRSQPPTVSFRYAGCHITVESPTEMTITPWNTSHTEQILRGILTETPEREAVTDD